MQVAGFIFLTRNWQKDETVLKEALDYYCQLKYTPQILLFPEGTDYCKDSKPASDRYAKKNDLLIYDYVLHPRTTGFNYIVQHLIKCDMIDAVYDVNMGYPEGIPINGEVDILNGRFPGEVHTKIRRYPISSLPTTDKDIQEWCLQRWMEKEETLRKFYEDDRKFVNDTCVDSPGGDTPLEGKSCRQRSNPIFLYLSLVYWLVFLLVSLYFLYAYSLARWFFLVVCVFYAVQGLLRDGIDQLIVSCFRS
ncbi:lysocardiolipin acyltransferase 1-like [Anneissia japonica]|uniref:lysocardiolipin acyltransferase 1-like n=1 Tax=Anneissia japonica TaxID=1529436 RepID=UPI0014255E5D|nr:lysocardiolipin acyltransferase 1-like [Anneissia japonica]